MPWRCIHNRFVALHPFLHCPQYGQNGHNFLDAASPTVHITPQLYAFDIDRECVNNNRRGKRTSDGLETLLS
ncbi:hypothetical protein BRAS3843_330029 [Bradyrhizobium sp. STM 3843]|nr:hypothetical protein BRAS3843_330029 [Bradyrhizobium sp. STM 3843]